MNLDQISARIADPASCLGQEIPALKLLTEKYPYAQIFSILYLKALSNQNDIGFEEALQKHAYRISDRMKLFDLIHEQPSVEIESIAESVETTEPKIQETENITEIVETAHEAQLVMDTISEPVVFVVQSTDLPVSVEESIFPIEVAPSVEKVDAIETAIETKIEVSAKEIPLAASNLNLIQNAQEDELNLEIISEVVATVYNENLENSIPEPEKIEIDEKISEQINVEISTIEKPDFDVKRSFTSWLKMGEYPQLTPESKPKEIVEKEIEVIEKQIDKIINQFIEKEPSISRPHKEFYSPSKKAKESVNPNSLIYTETLANIFAIQGNFPKAIVAYEQLMLTNPEKKIFFANRIIELKEKLK